MVSAASNALNFLTANPAIVTTNARPLAIIWCGIAILLGLFTEYAIYYSLQENNKIKKPVFRPGGFYFLMFIVLAIAGTTIFSIVEVAIAKSWSFVWRIKCAVYTFYMFCITTNLILADNQIASPLKRPLLPLVITVLLKIDLRNPLLHFCPSENFEAKWRGYFRGDADEADRSCFWNAKRLSPAVRDVIARGLAAPAAARLRVGGFSRHCNKFEEWMNYNIVLNFLL